MSGATMWQGGVSVQNVLDAIGAQMRVRNELGRAEDSRLAQPDRIIWTVLENTRRTRPATAATHYDQAGLEVFYEVSNEYEVFLRAIDVLGAESLETRLFNALIDLGLWSPGVEVTDGSLNSAKSVAAEEGAAIKWLIRIWTPLVYRRVSTAHIDSIGVSITTVDFADNVTGELP